MDSLFYAILWVKIIDPSKMLLNNWERHSFLIKQTKNEDSAIYKLPEKYRVVFEADFNGRLHKVFAYKGETILITGTNGAGKSKFLAYLVNDYKSQIILENLKSAVTETILMTMQEFQSTLSFLEQEPTLMSGTILDNLFVEKDMKESVLAVLDKYKGIKKVLHDHIINDKCFYTDTTEYRLKRVINLFRALYLAENRDFLLFDGLDEDFIEEVIKNNKDKVILVTGIYKEETGKKFDKVIKILNTTDSFIDITDDGK